jgi:hypothetical protein
MLALVYYEVPQIDALTSTPRLGFDLENISRVSTFVSTLGISSEDRRLEGLGFDMM